MRSMGTGGAIPAGGAEGWGNTGALVSRSCTAGWGANSTGPGKSRLCPENAPGIGPKPDAVTSRGGVKGTGNAMDQDRGTQSPRCKGNAPGLEKFHAPGPAPSCRPICGGGLFDPCRQPQQIA